eukprot:gene42528-54549_t
MGTGSIFLNPRRVGRASVAGRTAPRKRGDVHRQVLRSPPVRYGNVRGRGEGRTTGEVWATSRWGLCAWATPSGA